jgi:hypothetical protein
MPRGRRTAQAAQPQPPPAATTAAQPAAQPASAAQPVAAIRSSRSRNPPDNDGESFGFENISDASDEDQANARQARSEPAANTPNIQVNDPTPAVKKGTTALDIEYFYDRQKGRDTFCKECKQVVYLNHFSRILTGYIHGQGSPRCQSSCMAEWPNIYLLGFHFDFIPSTSSREISFRTVLVACSGKRLENPTARNCISSPL